MALTQVKTSAIADDAITQAKIANDAIDISEIKAGSDGELISFDANGNPVKIAAGTAGHFLKSQGDASQPIFAAVPSGVGGDTGIDLNDGVKARYGTGNDVSIQHNGTYFDVADLGLSGASSMWFGTASGDGIIFYVNKGVGNTYIARFSETDGCRLYHSTSQKLNTSSTGITITGNLEPEADNTRDLGSSTKRWANVYVGDMQLSNEGATNDIDGTWGSYTLQEGEDDLFLINRRSGKKYKVNLTEVN